MGHISACLSTPVHVLLCSITSPRTHCHALCGGAGPNLPLLWSESNLLDLFKTTTHSRLQENPKPGLSHALCLCGPACMLQAVTCVTGGWTQAAHVNHTLMRQTLKHVDDNNLWHSSSLMHAHNILCLTRTYSEWRVESFAKCAFFFSFYKQNV